MILCVVCLQIVKCITKNLFIYGNVVTTTILLQKLFNKPEIKYLLKYDDANFFDPKDKKTAEGVIANLKTYLSELMAVKGSRTKLAAQTFRTVVSACCGKNLMDERTLTRAAKMLVSAATCFFCCHKYPMGCFFLNLKIIVKH